jgi:hypothetical protein
VPKTFVDWCTVLGFVIALWPLLAKPRAYARRRILNWWAERSQQKTTKRIEDLQELLSKIELLPLLTEFENMVLLGLAGIAMFIAITPALAALVYLTSLIVPEPVSARELLKMILLAFIVVLNALIGFGIRTTLETFREQRSQAYRNIIQKDINELKARLKEHSESGTPGEG